MDSAGYQKFVEHVRVFKFLEGMILGMDMLYSLQEAFPYVQNKEDRRSTMLASPTINRSTLVFAPLKMESV
ncbi:hypothetical protein CsSME_00011053 [Camellia sinensis var. sinensis]